MISLNLQAEILPVIVSAPRVYDTQRVRIIKKQEIENSSYQNLGDILKKETSIDVSKEGLAGQTSVFFRGGESSHLLVLVDGQEVNDPTDPTRRFNFNTIDLASLERIEIIRGARSVQFGSDALVGVINLVTKKNLGEKLKLIQAGVGSFQTMETQGQLAHPLSPNLALSIAAKHYQTQGYSAAKAIDGDKDKVQRDYVRALLNYEKGKSQFSYSLLAQNLNQELDAGAGIDDPNARLYSRFVTQNLKGTYFFSENSNLQFKLGKNFIQRDFSDLKDEKNSSNSENSTYGGSEFFDLYATFDFEENHRLIVGNKYQKDILRIESLNQNDILTRRQFSQTGFYLVDELKISSFKYSLGGRFDHNNFNSEIYTGRFGVETMVKSHFNLYSSLGTGYKTPSLYQLHSPQYGSANLKPEESISFDFGYKSDFHKFDWQQSYFQNNFKNLIQFNSAKALENYENSKKAQVRGLEQSLSYPFYEHFRARANYTYMRAIDESLRSPLPLRSRHKGSLDLNYSQNENLNHMLELTAVGKRLNSSSSLVMNPGYGVLSYAINLKFKKADLKFKLENLLNKQYVELSGYNSTKRSGFMSLDYFF